MCILRLFIVAGVVSYVIWLFYTRILKKDIALTMVISWVLVATFLIYLVLGSISFLVEGSIP